MLGNYFNRGKMRNLLEPYYDFLIETAFLAGRLAMGHYQIGIKSETKSDGSPVTMADKKAEELIRQRVESRFPKHAIVGEEFGLKESENESHRWIIDPIDGTKSFVRGIPLFAVLLALEIEGKVELGAMYFPALDEMYSAATDMGAYCNGRRIMVSKENKLENAYFTCTSLGKFGRTGKENLWNEIVNKTYFQAGWGDAYGYALVASGRAEIMLDPVMSVWDAGPILPVMKESGGYFGDWGGKETIYGGEDWLRT